MTYIVLTLRPYNLRSMDGLQQVYKSLENVHKTMCIRAFFLCGKISFTPESVKWSMTCSTPILPPLTAKFRTSLVAQLVKNLPAVQEAWV